MSTVIHLPQGAPLSGSIGHTLGSMVAQQGAIRLAAMEAARFQKIQNSIASAPDRHTAVAIATQLPFKNMQEFEHTMKYLDQYHPQSEAATVDFKSYDDRGNEVTTAMSRQATRRMGPQTKLAQEEAYELNPTTGKYESMGKNVASNIDSNQTTPGASALDNQAADNIRSDQTANHANSNEQRLRDQAAYQQQQTSSNNYNNRLIVALGGKSAGIGPDGKEMFDAGTIPYDRLGAYRRGLKVGGDLMSKHGHDVGKALDEFFNGDLTASSFANPPPPEPVVPKPVPKPGIIKRGIDAVVGALTPAPDAKVTTPTPQIPKDPATADFSKQRAAIKGVPLRVEPNVAEDPHNPTIFYPKTAADMKGIPEGSTFLNPADGKHYVKAASVAPPAVENIQTSGTKGDVAPNLKGGTESRQLLGPINVDKEIQIAPGIFAPDGKIKDMDKAVREVERLRIVADNIYNEDKMKEGGFVSDNYKKAVKALHSLTTPMGEDDVKQGKTIEVDARSIGNIKSEKLPPTITVGPPLARMPNGDFYMSDIPADGKFYQNIIYRDGDDRFMVDAHGNRKSVEAEFNKKKGK